MSPEPKAKPAGRNRITLRGWIARLGLAVGVPAAILLGAELILRLVGFGHSAAFFIPDEKPGYFRTNPSFTNTFLPASFGLKPLNFRLPREKPAGEFRIFVIGESAAMGVPEPGFGVAPQLRAQLRAAYPGRDIAVYNLGVTAINSHAILPIVRQAAEFQPDLFVVYMGNNEIVGPFGPSSVATEGLPPLAIIRTNIFVRSTRLGQLMQRAVQALRPGTAPREWRGMEMFARNTIAAGDPKLAATYANFAANLHEMVRVARAAGAQVVLSTVAVNVRDSAPFASQSGANPNAETHFQLARSADAAGDGAAARLHYLAARDADLLRFRADSPVNQIIRAEAQAATAGLTLVDAARELGADAASSAPPAGAELFFEHVHLSWQGNYELARVLAAGAAGNLPGARQPWLSAAACAAAVGYTEFGHAGAAMSMDRLTARPPFTSQSTFAEARGRLQEEIQAANRAVAAPGALAAMADTVAAARRQDPANAFLLFHEATMRTQLGQFAAALELNTQFAAAAPAAPESTAQRAFLLQSSGRTNEAEQLLLQSAKDDPYYFQTYSLLAWLWGHGGQWPRAIDYFRDLVARMPGNLAVLHAYAGVLAGAAKWPEAEEQWRVILQSAPDDEEALSPLCVRMLGDGRADAAIELMLAAHAYNPRSFANNARLEQIYEAKGDREKMIAFMRDLAASGPVNSLLYIDLARLLHEAGRADEATAALRQAQTRATAEGNTAALATIRQMQQ